jgi:pimeloyl-ACP methyl ester carboxylesterase
MKRETVRVAGAQMALFREASDSPSDAPLLVWAHGWGQTHEAMAPLAQAMRHVAGSVLLDLPGFGASPLPPAAWGTADYADAAAEWLDALPRAPSTTQRVWIAHSFGCRVGLQLAARHPGTIDGLFLIAAAGLQRRRSPAAKARLTLRRWMFRVARQLTPEGPARDRLRGRFGSADYLQAGAMRPVLVKAVSEDLSEIAAAVRCPVWLVYGGQDTETPPELGARFNKLMPQSRLIVLGGFDHWNVLTDGRHQITQRVTEFLEQFA